jgi:hypothetical protein
MKADTFILLDTVLFSQHKPAYTQCAYLPDGTCLTVPVKRPHVVPIKDLMIDWTHYDPRLHLDLIQEAGFGYWRRALEHVTYPPLHDPYPDKLADWNTAIIRIIAKDMELKTNFQKASEIVPEFSDLPRPLEWTATDELSLINRALGADTYLTGPSWRRYAPSLDKVLEEHGIALEEVK